VARHQTDAELHKAVRVPPERETGMITLWDGWAIDSDPYQYILGKPIKRDRSDGKTEIDMTSATYHRTPGKALGAFYQKQLREKVKGADMTLSQAIDAALQIEQRIREIIREPDFQP